MRLFYAFAALVVVLGFNNCGSSGSFVSERGFGSSSLSSQDPADPAPNPNPPVPYAIQPNAMNSMADVKPMPAGNVCPAGYGTYDLLNTTPAIDGANWVHTVCVKPFAAGETSVISDAQFVSGNACPAGTELLQTLPLNPDSNVQRWSMSYSICIKRQVVPVTASFITYFYFSAPNANCRAGDSVSGMGLFCTVPNGGGQCVQPVQVNFCKSVQ